MQCGLKTIYKFLIVYKIVTKIKQVCSKKGDVPVNEKNWLSCGWKTTHNRDLNGILRRIAVRG